MKCGQKETDEGVSVSLDTFYGDSWFASVKAAAGWTRVRWARQDKSQELPQDTT
jgi:hypothetical protein